MTNLIPVSLQEQQEKDIDQLLSSAGFRYLAMYTITIQRTIKISILARSSREAKQKVKKCLRATEQIIKVE